MIRWWRLLPFGVAAFVLLIVGIPLSLGYALTMESLWGWDSRYPTFVAVMWMLATVFVFAAPLIKPSFPEPPVAYVLVFFASILYGFLFGDPSASGDRERWIFLGQFLAIFFGTLLFLYGPFLILLLLSIAKESTLFRQVFSAGRGGNARWAGILTYSNMETLTGNGGIFYGGTLIQDTFFKTFVGAKRDDDSHHITLAATGAGKSVTCIWPTMQRYDGPMVVLDPKGEHAAFGEEYRFPSTVLDPFNQLGGKSSESTNYNPLSEIDVHADGARAFLNAISSACVMDDPKDIHFSESAKTIIEGVIALVLATRPADQHNLPHVVDMFRGFDSELGIADPEAFDGIIAEMTTCDAAGGLPMDAASLLLAAADRERGSMLTTCYRSLKWINDPAMRKHLSETRFHPPRGTVPSLKSIVQAKGRDTLYIILPFEYMEQSSQIRWMRMMLSLVSIHLFQNPRKGQGMKPLIIVMDEFFKLGYMPVLEEGIVTARGAGAKWWILLQDIGQLKSRFKTNWETFLGSSNIQVFGVQDQATVEWVATALGGLEDSSTDKYPLMRPDEVRGFLGKESPTQIIIPTTGLPMRLERLSYKSIKRFRGLG